VKTQLKFKDTICDLEAWCKPDLISGRTAVRPTVINDKTEKEIYMWNKDDKNPEESGPADARLLLAALQHAEGGVEMVISMDAWPDSSAWGIFLADLARHIGDAYEQAQGIPTARTLARVLELFQKEMAHPTDQTRGHLHRGASPADCDVSTN
jgi:hypothetical protein